MAKFTDWESYFYPETYDAATGQGVLRNKFGERDFFELRALEYRATAKREQQMHAGVASIDRTFGADHLRAIHGYLFQDVYEWAGQFRTVNMGKGGAVGFASVRDGEVEQLLDGVQEFVQSYDWAQLDRRTVVNNAAVVFAYVNQAHGFREGNGRTSKMFMEHVVEATPYTLDFSRIDADWWNEASEMSRPQPDRLWIDPTPLLPVFDRAAVDRPAAGESIEHEPHRDLRAASYPQAATESTRPTPGSAQAPTARPYGRGADGPDLGGRS